MAVYFVRKGALVKIGYSWCVSDRVRELQTHHVEKLEVLRVVEHAGRPTEKWFHRKFSHKRVKGEWFGFDDAMLTTVAPDELPPRRKAPPPALDPVRNPELRRKIKAMDAAEVDLKNAYRKMHAAMDLEDGL